MITPEQRKAAMATLMAVADTIRECGRCPAGVLYAGLMSRMDLEQFQSLIGILKRAGMVKEEFHELVWIGPDKAKGGSR